MDYLKALSQELKGKIETHNLSNCNFSKNSTRKAVVKDYRGYKIVIHDFGNLFAIQIIIESDLLISVNKPEEVFSMDHPIDLGKFPYRTYICEGDENPLENIHYQSFWADFGRKIEAIKLSKDEAVFFYCNKISFVLSADRNTIPPLDSMIDLINQYNEIFKKESDTRIYIKNYPEELRLLVPSIKKWGVSDDGERDELVANMSVKQKTNLINKVYPLMDKINDFLDSFKEDPLSEEAMRLGNLAELVTELNLEVNA